MWLLDTNICIYLIKQKPRQVLDRVRTLDIASVSISSVTLAELQYGVAKSSRPEQNGQALAAFLAPLGVEPFADEAAAAYGEGLAFPPRAVAVEAVVGLQRVITRRSRAGLHRSPTRASVRAP